METNSCLAVPSCIETPGINWTCRNVMPFRVYQFEHSWNIQLKPRRLALSCNFLSSSPIIHETPSTEMDASHCHVISCLAVPSYMSSSYTIHETPGINWTRRTLTQFRVYQFDHSWNTQYKPRRLALSCNFLSNSSIIHETPSINPDASHCHAISCLPIRSLMKHSV